MSNHLHSVAALVVVLLMLAWSALVSPFNGSGPGAVAPPGVRENPASWKAVYVPYVVDHGSGGGGGYNFGK